MLMLLTVTPSGVEPTVKLLVKKVVQNQVGSICEVDLPNRLDGRIGWVEKANQTTMEQAG
jgi:hypothetical protein